MSFARHIACSAMAVSLSIGCAGGASPPDRHYRLEAPPPTQRLAAPLFRGTLVVELPRGDSVTAGRALAYRRERESLELRRHAYSLWADTPTRMLQRAIADYLRAAGVAERVVTTDLRIEGEYVMTCRLERLERVLERPPTVELALELAVLAGHNRTLAFHGAYRAEREAAGADVEDAVVALRATLGELLERFVVEVAAAR